MISYSNILKISAKHERFRQYNQSSHLRMTDWICVISEAASLITRRADINKISLARNKF